MNLEKIRWAARWAEKFAAATKTYAGEMAAELARAEAAKDPLGLFIYQARAGYRRTADADKNKSGRKTDLELRQSYQQACALGFEGPLRMWEALMRWGKQPD